MPIVSSSVSRHCWKEPGSVFKDFLQVFIYIDQMPLSVLFSRMNIHSILILSWYDRSSNLFVAFWWTPYLSGSGESSTGEYSLYNVCNLNKSLKKQTNTKKQPTNHPTNIPTNTPTTTTTKVYIINILISMSWKPRFITFLLLALFFLSSFHSSQQVGLNVDSLI